MTINSHSIINTYDILGLGAPCVDYVLKVSEAFMETIPGPREGMEAVNFDTFVDILQRSQTIPKIVAGGSCCNTIKGLSQLGNKCTVIGKIGTDQEGEGFIKDMLQNGVHTFFSKSPTPTTRVGCLVTPDGRRTFRDFFGASLEMSSKDLDPTLFNGVKLVHIEGYALYNGDLVQQTMALAKSAGALVSFDLASFQLVLQFKELVKHLLTQYVDILFANELETEALTGIDAERSGDQVRQFVDLAVIKLGENGCIVVNKEGQKAYPAIPAKVIDTTGAGDLFASGFLHGYLEKQPLELCAYYGALSGAAIVEVLGAELSTIGWDRIKYKISQHATCQ